MKEIAGVIGTALSLYFLFDFFVWNGGFVNPSFFARLDSIMVLFPF
ncbi:hypothetical protein HALDL1_13570 [Halobacterium sp. DL1]|jgi:hypothetical protein|nr:hypothetical protein HALDL1_13570 [Halobacterium sp. DL1]